MGKVNDSAPESFTYIRYNIFYSAGLIIAAIILILISITPEGSVYYHNFFLRVVDPKAHLQLAGLGL